MAAAKKEIFDPGRHPNAGTPVTMLLFNMATNEVVRRSGVWNGTHWVMVKKKTGETSSIPPHLRIKGWSE